MLKNIRKKVAVFLLRKIRAKINNGAPDVTVGDNYLRRWHIIPENKLFNIYYHEIRASDLDRHLHDHPYFFSSFILEGGYYEHTENGRNERGVGDINLHTPWFVHRLQMKDEDGVNSIFITGPKMRVWGFKTDNGWVPNQEYLNLHGVQGVFQKPITVNKDDTVEEERKAS